MIRPRTALATLTLMALVQSLALAPAAQAPRERVLLPFRAVEDDGATHYVMGANCFTRGQLVEFVIGVERFLARSRGQPPGRQSVWRVSGKRGYISLSTSPFVQGPRYLLTLSGEGVRPIESDSGVLAMASLLGLRLLEPEGGGPPASLAPQPEYAP